MVHFPPTGKGKKDEGDVEEDMVVDLEKHQGKHHRDAHEKGE
jgi:hypothetical protein